MLKKYDKIAATIKLEGIVQGIGFRPYVHRLAKKHNLTGQTFNSTNGITITIEGKKKDIVSFFSYLSKFAPPLSEIENIKINFHKLRGFNSFQIKESLKEKEKNIFVSPDISICNKCLKELFDPKNFRYKYPFINCTNCGPRFTIIYNVPYDRDRTTMRKFPMCQICKDEYYNINNRRYHAQPIGCKFCGPQIKLIKNNGCKIKTRDIFKTISLFLKQGDIIGIKSLGGFQLCCDALNEKAVQKLRERKKRITKPFALMSYNINNIKKYCIVNSYEEKLLTSFSRPIVLLKKKKNCPIAFSVAPYNKYLGIMLPYTPLHYLILKEAPLALVTTSGNISEDPLIIKNDEIIKKLGNIADYFLLHNREICTRCDDSVSMVVNGKNILLRRARGYAPKPFVMTHALAKILACGAESKNTFCLTKDKYIFLSQHIGDLKTLETFKYFKEEILHYKKLFKIEPEIITCDLHPQYLSSQFAENYSLENSCKLVKIQHHHAHVVSCMFEYNVFEKIIGVVFDGAGLGLDGHIWGGEFLISNYSSFERIGRFKYISMPGGDVAIKEPYRMLISFLYTLFNKKILIKNILEKHLKNIDFKKIFFLTNMIDKKINSPLTSSVGRLFDAVSVLLDLGTHINFEGELAIKLEMKALQKKTKSYEFKINKEDILVIDPTLIFEGIFADLKNKVSISEISSKFHFTIAKIILTMCKYIRKETKIKKVALSGGVFQNRLLLTLTLSLLKQEKFICLTHSKIPSNDGGISLGQAIIARENN